MLTHLRLSDIDTPAAPAPPSPILTASQSWTSGEIPIFLHSRLSTAETTSSYPTTTGSVCTLGQSTRLGTGDSCQSSLSYRTLHDGALTSSSSVSMLPSVLSAQPDYKEEYSFEADQASVFSLSAYLASPSIYGGATDRNTLYNSLASRQQDMNYSSTLPVLSPKRTRPKTLNDLTPNNQPTLHPHDKLNLIDCHGYHEPDAPSYPTPTLLSPTGPTAFNHATDANAFKKRHVSAPLIHSSISVVSAAPLGPPPALLPTRKRPRSNSNPHLPALSASLHPGMVCGAGGIPEWLHDMHIQLWIDQEGFRAIQPRLELVAFSYSTGINVGGERLDVAEFAMRTRQTWHFHYAPLDSAPVLRRLTVNGDMNDYISRQAALALKDGGVYAVESTEDKGRIAWKFEYHVEDRRAPDSGKIIGGEKRFTPLRFVCNPTLLSAEHGKKIKLLQLVRKSFMPKLQSIRIASISSMVQATIPHIVVGEWRISKDNKSGSTGAEEGLRLGRPNPLIEQRHHTWSSTSHCNDHILGISTASMGSQHIVSPSVRHALLPAQHASGGLPPPSHGEKG